jgi:hypothetical protein
LPHHGTGSAALERLPPLARRRRSRAAARRHRHTGAVLRRWPRGHVLAGVWGGVALAAAVGWLAVSTWQYLHPADLPSLLGDTGPMALAAVAGLVGLVGGLAGLLFSRRRLRFLAVTLVAAAGLAAPLAVTGVALATLNDWNFANRAFIGALFPVFAAELDGDLPQVTTTVHYVIHHAHPLPDWEVQRLEQHWQDLRGELGTEPPGRIDLYLDDAGTLRQRIGANGATDGRLVFSVPPGAATGCATALHEIAHSFMYTPASPPRTSRARATGARSAATRSRARSSTT